MMKLFQDFIANPDVFAADTRIPPPPSTQTRTPNSEAHAPSPTHIDKTEFKQIFIDRWPDFQRLYPRYNNQYYNEVIQKMLDCGNPKKMGYRQYRCLSCGHKHRVAFSCKSTFCLSCAPPYTQRWVDYISRRLFPGVIYRHIILTVPDFLRIWFYRFRELLDPFIQAGFDCLNEVFATSARSKLDIGSIILPQTFGRKANWNTHLHIIQTAGGIDENNRWRHQTYIPYDELHHAWKDHLLGMLKSNILDPRMEADIERADKLYPDGLVAHLVKGLVPPGGKGLARYLAKYVVSPPIAIRRIESYDGVHVRYWYRDHKTAQIEYETLPVLRFIGRMVEHILPKGFQRIRYFGLHSNRRYSKIRQCLPELLPNKPPKINNECYRVLPRPSFEKLYSETFNSNPLKCPECGDKMELELIWHPAYGVITSYEHLLYLESAPYDTPRGPPRGAAALARRTQRVVQIPLPFM